MLDPSSKENHQPCLALQRKQFSHHCTCNHRTRESIPHKDEEKKISYNKCHNIENKIIWKKDTTNGGFKGFKIIRMAKVVELNV